MGRLTKDPELRFTQNNTAVCSFTLAVNRVLNKDVTDFINCQAWQKTAEFIAQYFTKGQQMALTGRIQTRTWENQEGKKQYVTEVIAEQVFFADSKKAEKPQEEHQQEYSEIDYDLDFLPFDLPPTP
jgi:single-strand DNA-binding protein